MSPSLLENLRSIPDRRRAEGKRFDLATVLLYTILGMVAGANSYRQMHEFIRVHRRRLNRHSPDERQLGRQIDPMALFWQAPTLFLASWLVFRPLWRAE